MFLSPWKHIRAFPKIIDFDSNGNVVAKRVAADDLINMKMVLDSNNEPKTLTRAGSRTDNRSNRKNIFDIIQNVSEIKFKPNPTKKKILLQCSADYCRFLSCPDIKKFCVVCLVARTHTAINEEYNVTTCQKVSTESLIYERTFWLPPAHQSNRNGDIHK